MSASGSLRKIHPAVACLLLLCLRAPAAVAEAPRITASPLAPRLAVEPRRTATFAVAVRNEGAAPLALAMSVVPPQELRILAVGGDFTVGGGETVVRIASVSVPSNTLAGVYPVTCRFADRDDPAIAAECEVLLEVLPKASLAVEVLESPSSVIAGQPYAVSFSVSNTGNVSVRFDLSVHGSPDRPMRVEGVDRLDERELAPGARDVVTLAMKTDTSTRTPRVNHLQLIARFRQGQAGAPAEDSIVAGTATSTVEIVPLSLGGSSLMHTVDAQVDTKGSLAVNDGIRGALLETFSAAGSIDEAGEHRIDLLVRLGLASDMTALFAPPDTFSLGYRQDLGELRMGELTYTISPLLAKDQAGFGVRGVLELAPFEVGALYAGDLWTPTGSSVLAAYLRRTIPRSPANADALYDVRVSVIGELSDHATFDLWQRLAPFPGLVIQLDAALEIGAGLAFVPALLASLEGAQGPVTYHTQFVRSLSGFDGVYSDVRSFSANASVGPLLENLWVGAGLWLTDANPDLNPVLPSADRMTKASLNASGTIPGWGVLLSGGWELERHDDRLLSAFDTWKNTISLKAQKDAGTAAFGVSSSLRFLSDAIGGSRSFEQKHSVDFTSALPRFDAQVHASLSYDGVFDDTGSEAQTIDIVLGMQGATDRTEWNAGATNQYRFGDAGLQSLSVGINGIYQHTFSWGHVLEAQGTLGASRDLRTWTPSLGLSVTYGVPFDVPISRKKGTAIVRGTVYHRETGAKLAGVLLRLDGLAAVTDKEGAFTFYVPHAGTCSLRIEGGSAAAGLIPADPARLRIDIAPDSELTVDVAMTRGATVRGTVSLYRPAAAAGLRESVIAAGNGESTAPAELVKAQGLGNVLLEIDDGVSRRRRLTNANGGFLFEQMIPGTYTLRVVDALLPSYTRFEQDSFSLVLAPGDERTLELRVVPEQRQVKILPGETTLVLTGRAGVRPGASIGTGTPAAAAEAGTTETASTAPAAAEPEPLEQAPAAPAPSEPAPPEPAPVEPAPVEPALPPSEPAEPTEPAPTPPKPEPGETRFAPLSPSREELVMAAQAAFDAPELAWQEYLATMLHPVVPGAMPVPVAAVPEEPAAPAPAAAPAATPAVKTPAPTAPTAAAPAAAAPTVPAATPTTPAAPALPVPASPAPIVTIDIPLPMPTPRPTVTVPVPSPTPQPFTP